jgi:hypothetical protein
MPYVRKTEDEYRLFVDYGQGWEHEHTESSLKAIRQSVKDYKKNAPQYPVKWTGPHRVKIGAE